MAINNALPVRSVTVNRLGTLVLIRHGQDDGGFAAAGTIVVEDDGNLRLATKAEIDNYNNSNANESAKAAAKAIGLEMKNFPAITSIAELNDYRSKLEALLVLMFKEVFD